MAFAKTSARRYSYTNNKKIEKLQRTIDMLAYGSLFLDICIAFITTMSLLKIARGEFILESINYLLTSVVAMSLISGGMLLYLKHYEKLMTEFLRIKYKIRMPLPSPYVRYSFKWKLRRKWEKFKRSLGI